MPRSEASHGFSICAALFTLLFGLFAVVNYGDTGHFGFAGTAFLVMGFFWVLAYTLRNVAKEKSSRTIEWILLVIMALGLIEELMR